MCMDLRDHVYIGVTVCLSVCLSVVCNVGENGPEIFENNFILSQPCTFARPQSKRHGPTPREHPEIFARIGAGAEKVALGVQNL